MWRLLEVAEHRKTAKARGANKDFSAFVHAKTAKHFGNYRDCIGLCDMVETFEVEEQTETA